MDTFKVATVHVEDSRNMSKIQVVSSDDVIDNNVSAVDVDEVVVEEVTPSFYFFFSTTAVPLSFSAASLTLPLASRLNSMVTPL